MSPGVLLLVLSAASASRVITRAMIRGPQVGGGGLQRVPLLSPEEGPPRASARVMGPPQEGSSSAEEAARWEASPYPSEARREASPYPSEARREANPYPSEARRQSSTDTSLREVSQRLDEDSSMEEVQLRFSEPAPTTTDLPTTVPTEIQLQVNTTDPSPSQLQVQNKTTGNRTRLYPVARLWEERTETDIWSLLHAAYLCCFSGLNCFSDKVYPMFRSYLGLNTGTRPTRYPLLLPRTSTTQDNDTEYEESRGLLKGRLVKELLVGLLLAHASLLPWLGGVGLASGKALFTGLLSLGAAGAVAAINSHNNYFM